MGEDKDRALAREIIGNVNNYAEEHSGELSISAFGPLSTRIAEALATVRKAEREAALKSVTDHLQAKADALDGRQETECPTGTGFYSEAKLRRRIATEIAALERAADSGEGENHG